MEGRSMTTATEPRTIGRRNLLKYACGCVVGGAGLMATAGFVAPTRARAATPTVTPDEALAKLKDGNDRYLTGRDVSANIDPVWHKGDAELAQGQQPHSCILACSDSRVIPEFVFNKGKGELFVIRNAGNLPGRQAIASAEFGVAFLGCAIIVVLGHSGCGAVKGAIDLLTKDADLPGQLPDVIAPIGAAVARVRGRPGDLVENAVAENVMHTVSTLAAQPPVLSKAVNKGQIKIVGAVYDLKTGRVNFL
jgi:carbonic anhydrase